MENKRIQLIDALRGVSIILMVAYHTGYDLVVFEFLPESILYNPFLDTLENIFAGVFILLAGISSRFSRNNFKRGLLVLGASVLVTIVSVIMEAPIYFGILHLLGACMLLYALLDKFNITYPAVMLFGFIVLFFNINPFPNLKMSFDYFPIIPWGFLFFFGSCLAVPIIERKLPDWFYDAEIPFFPFVGRHTLIIYLAHQPIIYGVVFLISLLV